MAAWSRAASAGPEAPGTARGRCHSPVEHVEVEAGEHALAGPAGREGAAAAHHHVQHREGDEVSLLREGGRSSQGPHRGACWAGGRGACGEPAGLTRKEQLSSPIMMCVSSGNGAGPRLTLDMSLSSCNQEEPTVTQASPSPRPTPQPRS